MQVNLDEIVRGCKAKEEKAFELLYRNYYRILFGIALRYSRTRTEAEDILQDSFIKIFNSIDSFNGKGSFEGWMKRIVQNTAINSYRSHLKFDLHVAISDQIDVAESDDFEAVLQLFDANGIVELLNQLPEGYRLVINLFFIDGYSHKEISEMLNISVGTSKSQLHKAKANLKTIIELQLKQQVV
jgi:RNA polymerase sigma factor (sigma-70 family)